MGAASEHERLRAQAERYYSGKFAEHGATAAGVDWNGEASQELRFRQLLFVAPPDGPVGVLDYGCGYGALAGYLLGSGRPVTYVGYDVSRPMVDHARSTFAGDEQVSFLHDEADLEPQDYAVASGIFNVKLDADPGEWRAYVAATVDRLAELGRVGFAFNMLTVYSDRDRMRDDLFYADPGEWLDFCKRRHAPWVSVLHDYGLWEFTIAARREPRSW